MQGESMPLSNSEYQRRWRERHPGLNSIRVMESKKRHWSRFLAYQCKYERERYHRIQDKAGCYSDIRDFYPGYRILKALETAEVVEI